MSAGESAVLRSAKPHIGKENAMLPPLASPNRMLSISKGQKYVTQKAGIVRRQNSDEETKVRLSMLIFPGLNTAGVWEVCATYVTFACYYVWQAHLSQD